MDFDGRKRAPTATSARSPFAQFPPTTICATCSATTSRPCSGRRELAASPAAGPASGAIKLISDNTSPTTEGAAGLARTDDGAIIQRVHTEIVDGTGGAWPQRAKPVQAGVARQIAAPASLLNLREISQKKMRRRQYALHASDTWGIGKKGQCPCRNSLAGNQKNPYRDFAAAMLQPSLGVSSLDFMAASLTRPFFWLFCARRKPDGEASNQKTVPSGYCLVPDSYDHVPTRATCYFWRQMFFGRFSMSTLRHWENCPLPDLAACQRARPRPA